VSVIGHLIGPEDLLLHDSLAHDSILGGARLAGARRRPFPHNDYQTLEKILREVRSSVRRVLIAVEGVYSMDGDITPLPEFITLRKRFGTLLFVDEAHSLGVLGRTGRGVGEHYGVDRRDVDIWMGTMSKTLASCGGYIAGSAALIEYLKYSVPGFIYSVGMSPANAAAALEALRILTAEPERAQTCQQRAAFFVRLCRERGIDTGDSDGSAVVPCIVGNSYACIRLAEGLLKRGIHVHPILYPAVAESEARLRFFVTAAHTEEQLRYTADALAEELARLALLPRKVEAADAVEEVPVSREVS
jgi:7-keto-8-aminopelargonate synthetase-like enzyme